MGEWDQMAEYVSRLDDGDETKLRSAGNNASSSDGSSNGTFFRAVLSVRRGKVFNSLMTSTSLVCLFFQFHLQ